VLLGEMSTEGAAAVAVRISGVSSRARSWPQTLLDERPRKSRTVGEPLPRRGTHLEPRGTGAPFTRTDESERCSFIREACDLLLIEVDQALHFVA
jgi:hypothetical protein